MWMFCRCAHMFTICMPAGSPVTGVMDGCELPCVCWGLCKSNKCSWSLSRLSMTQPHLLARTWNKVCNSVSFVSLKRPCASLGRTIYSQGHIRNCEDLVVFHREAQGPGNLSLQLVSFQHVTILQVNSERPGPHPKHTLLWFQGHPNFYTSPFPSFHS